jgi:hypothetical protein
MSDSQKAAAEAVEILSREVWRLPAGVQNGTIKTLVDAIVRAAVARVAESQAQVSEQPAAGWAKASEALKPTDVFTIGDDPRLRGAAPTTQPAASFDQQRVKLGLPRKDRT